ncbi:uncharacterized protein JCM6883_000242 [Sporobolomyces salmoneus]|uniref:uncharacterized protein n=1 Tax=Sporobolomyces salmoneus TaxID=183962 RepID=UPI0031727F2E
MRCPFRASKESNSSTHADHQTRINSLFPSPSSSSHSFLRQMTQNDIELDTLSTNPTQRSPRLVESVKTVDSESHQNLEDTVPPVNKEQFESYPEDAQAWIQVAAVSFQRAVLFATGVGGIYSFGVLSDALFSAGVGTASQLTWIGSSQATVQAVFAVLVGRLIAHYGARRCAVVGSLLLGLGPLLGSFCTHSLIGLALTEGVLFGMGEALLFFASATLPSSYFLKRRNVATGIAYSGGGIGGAVLSLALGQLLKHLSIAWTLRAYALILTSVSLPAALIIQSRLPRQPFRSGAKIFDFNLFKDPSFCFLLLGTSVGIFPLFVPPFFLPLYGTSIGLSKSTSSYVLAGYNLASAIGRIVFGIFADAKLGSLNSLIVCLGSVSITMWFIWPFSTTIPALAVFAVVNGVAAGGFFSLIPGVVSSLFGSTRLTLVFTLLLTAWTPAYLFGSPLAGMLVRAQTAEGPKGGIEAFRPAIFYAAALSTLSCALVSAPKILEIRKRRQAAREEK